MHLENADNYNNNININNTNITNNSHNYVTFNSKPQQSYQVKLPIFEGPFDLLFHLIEEQKINIYDIPISAITAQYLEYLQMLEILDIEIATSFLVMAATLLEIKSKMLLPQQKNEKEHQDLNLQTDSDNYDLNPSSDARSVLVVKLLEYKKFKYLANQLRELEKNSSRIFIRAFDSETNKPHEILSISFTPVDLRNLFINLIRRKYIPQTHKIIIDKISVEQKIEEIRKFLLATKKEIEFIDLLSNPKDKKEIVLSFLALLEMAKNNIISIKQSKNFAPIKISLVEDIENSYAN